MEKINQICKKYGFEEISDTLTTSVNKMFQDKLEKKREFGVKEEILMDEIFKEGLTLSVGDIKLFEEEFDVPEKYRGFPEDFLDGAFFGINYKNKRVSFAKMMFPHYLEESLYNSIWHHKEIYEEKYTDFKMKLLYNENQAKQELTDRLVKLIEEMVKDPSFYKNGEMMYKELAEAFKEKFAEMEREKVETET